ncbi:MAG: alpha/beta fold hydrolase [Pseudomonadota bacterium]
MNPILKRFFALALVGSLGSASGVVLGAEVTTRPPLEAYGTVPTVRAAALSNDGSHIALLCREQAQDFIRLISLDERKQSQINIAELNPKAVRYIGNRYLLLSAAADNDRLNERHNTSVGFAYFIDTQTGNSRPLLNKAAGFLQPYEFSDPVIGVLSGSGELLVPARTYSRVNRGVDTSLNGAIRLGSAVFRVDPDSGRSEVFVGDRPRARRMSGARQRYANTASWVVSSSGEVLARSDYEQRSNQYSILAKTEAGWETIYDNSAVADRYIGGKPFTIVGTTLAEDAIVLAGLNAEQDEAALYHLTLDGRLSEPLYWKRRRDIQRVLTDDNRRVVGIEYSGLEPDYLLFDPRLKSAYEALKGRFGGYSLELIDWSETAERVLFRLSGAGESGSFYLFESATGGVAQVAQTYDLAPEWIGAQQAISYRAADGLEIPAIVTWPPGEKHKSLPTIVLPHGGPATHDQLGFDWMAQFFASRGYLVLQPNFRGSSGFGDAFRRAGYGAWGGAMQDDIHAGVQSLTAMNWSDPARVCIVGASYGGYAALAGGVKAPELFRCIAAIAPVTDLIDLLEYERRETGRRSYNFEYWTQSIGKLGADAKALAAASPARNADAINAPVLLIHGRADDVVPIAQSRKMRRALKKAKAAVELVTLVDADHWLSSTESRVKTLKVLYRFVEEHIGSVR